MKLIKKFQKNSFLFEELVKRDFKEKYKRTILGMLWSVLSPMLTFLIMKLIFARFFGRDIPHYTTYLFSGNVILAYYKEATKGGMNSLMSNAKIFTKINVPKYMFLLSKNVSALVNFGLTLCVYFIYCAFDGIHFGIHTLALIYPIICLLVMCIGIGMILSALYVFFRDIQYLYDVFLTLLTYVSAIFYQIDSFGKFASIFYLNPVYCNIYYFRTVMIEGCLPSPELHFLCAFYAVALLLFGCHIYKKNNHQFLYYV